MCKGISMTGIMPVCAPNIAYPQQATVASKPQANLSSSGTISFCANKDEDKGKSYSGLLTLATLAVAATLGVVFRKNIAGFFEHLKNWNKGDFIIKRLARKAEKKDVHKFDEVISYLRQTYTKTTAPDMKHAIVHRMDTKMKEKYGISAKEAVLLGYETKAKNFVFTKVVTSDKLDSKFVRMLGGKSILKCK